MNEKQIVRVRSAAIARQAWPDQQQDPERTGAGWDVQAIGAK